MLTSSGAFRTFLRSWKVTGIRTRSAPLPEARIDSLQELAILERFRDHRERAEVAVGRQPRIAAEQNDAPQNGGIGKFPVIGEASAVEDRHLHVEEDDGVVGLLKIDGVDAVAHQIDV